MFQLVPTRNDKTARNSTPYTSTGFDATATTLQRPRTPTQANAKALKTSWPACSLTARPFAYWFAQIAGYSIVTLETTFSRAHTLRSTHTVPNVPLARRLSYLQ